MSSSDQLDERKSILRSKTLQITSAITNMAIMGVTSIAPALPKMAQELNRTTGEIGLLITVFTGPMIVFTLIFGLLGDKIGRKKIIVPSLFLFGVAGGMCSLTKDFNLLMILRLVQGIGGASLFPLAISVICDIYSGKERTTAIGYNSSANQLGHIIFPAVGGALAMLGWNYPFLLATLAIPIGLLAVFSMDDSCLRNNQSFKEYLAGAFGSVKSKQAIGLFATAVILFVINYGAYMTYLPFLLADSFGASSFLIGLILLVMYLASSIMASQLGRLAKRTSERKLMKLSLLAYVPTLIAMPLAPSIWTILLPIVAMGVLWGVAMPAMYAILAEVAPENCRAAFMAVDELFVRAGQTLGPILMIAAFGAWGISGVYYAEAAFAVLLLTIVAFTIK